MLTHETGHIPVVAPQGADGLFSLLWLIIALPLAGAVILLVGGADKADAVAQAFDDTVPIADCPVRGVRPQGGSVTWHLDAAAASKLSGDLEDVTPT